MAADSQPVIVVGAGPAGMTAALELSRFGVPVRLVDKAAAPGTTSRAVGVQARTLELFEQRGIADGLVKAGNPSRWVSTYDAGRRVFRLDFEHVNSKYQYLLFVSQAETERALRDQLGRQGVAIEWGVELVGLAQAGAHGGRGGVTAVVRHPDGRLEAVAGTYLLAADGAHSTARSTLGVEFAGRPLPDTYALGDVRIDGDLPATDAHIFSSRHGFMGLFPMGGNHFRLIASHPPGDPKRGTDPTLAEIQAVYDQRSHIPARFHDLTWSSWFHINSRAVERMRVGRMFLLGDAAHIHSPAGAQGMNTGIQDAVNLGWKLALTLRGRAAAGLLDTYAADRQPVVRTVLANTETLTGAIGSESAAFRVVFDHLAPLLLRSDFVQTTATTQMSQVGVAYRDAPLSETHHRGGDLHGGDRVPPETPVTADGRPGRVADLLDPGRFTLLVATAAHDDAARATAAVGARGDLVRVCPIAPPPGDAADRYTAAFGTRPALVLVRPDGYAGLVCPAADDGRLAAYLDRWLTPEGDPRA